MSMGGGGREIVTPLRYLHPDKYEHSEVQSYASCHEPWMGILIMRMRVYKSIADNHPMTTEGTSIYEARDCLRKKNFYKCQVRNITPFSKFRQSINSENTENKLKYKSTLKQISYKQKFMMLYMAGHLYS